MNRRRNGTYKEYLRNPALHVPDRTVRHRLKQAREDTTLQQQRNEPLVQQPDCSPAFEPTDEMEG